MKNRKMKKMSRIAVEIVSLKATNAKETPLSPLLDGIRAN